MKEQITKISEKTLDNVIQDLQDVVRIPSVRNLEDKAKGAPFGTQIRKALDTVLAKAQDYGMRTYVDPEGYYGYIEVGPKDAKEMVGIVGHLDVVPAGDEEQWTEAPAFSGEIVDEKLVSRGSLDDKGPVIINLHAVKNLVDLGVEFKKRVRIILGTAEETTWECMDKYLEKEEKPTISYSPDANFPLIHAEKTIIQFDANIKSSAEFEVESLGAYNAVADKAIYRGSKVSELIAELEKLSYEYEKISDKEVKVIGKGAHAMACHLGINAIARLCIALNNIGETSPAVEFIATYVKETHGAELIQGEIKDEISGELKFNIGRMLIKDGNENIGMDTRIPVLVDEKEILKKYKTLIEENGFEYVHGKTQDKLYVEEDSFLVSTLMKVYKDVTGEVDAKPLTSGGGTYARALDNCVAFGCVFESQNMIDKMHQPNECFELKFLQPALEIYTNAINELLK
ncbi:MAG: Sapep family Mn(2+)-dependent dipeptidase [Mycoplasmatales bacterium]